jgi:hypothetical protein
MAVYNKSQSLQILHWNWGFPRLVLEVDGSIEVWDLRIDRFADDFPFASVKESAHF